MTRTSAPWAIAWRTIHSPVRTARLVPATRTASHSPAARIAASMAGGSDSPKKTMSGLSSPSQASQVTARKSQASAAARSASGVMAMRAGSLSRGKPGLAASSRASISARPTMRPQVRHTTRS